MREARPINRKGDPVPWLTQPAIDFLDGLDWHEKEVFEWGTGYGTIWWSRRARQVVSIETERDWYERIRLLVGPNCSVVLRDLDPSGYVFEIEKWGGAFDVIVIDGPGHLRPKCSAAAVRCLRTGGVVILDNSDQCPRSAEILRASGLIQVDFTGFPPGQGYAHSTSIFLDRGYDITVEVQPRPSVAQPNIWRCVTKESLGLRAVAARHGLYHYALLITRLVPG
jgi:hypothetical protein